MKSKKINNDQELIKSDPISCPQNQMFKLKNHLIFPELWPFETGHNGYLLLGASGWGHSLL